MHLSEVRLQLVIFHKHPGTTCPGAGSMVACIQNTKRQSLNKNAPTGVAAGQRQAICSKGMLAPYAKYKLVFRFNLSDFNVISF